MFPPSLGGCKLKLSCRQSPGHALCFCVPKLLNLWLNWEPVSWIAFQHSGKFCFFNQQASTEKFYLEPLIDTVTER